MRMLPAGRRCLLLCLHDAGTNGTESGLDDGLRRRIARRQKRRQLVLRVVCARYPWEGGKHQQEAATRPAKTEGCATSAKTEGTEMVAYLQHILHSTDRRTILAAQESDAILKTKTRELMSHDAEEHIKVSKQKAANEPGSSVTFFSSTLSIDKHTVQRTYSAMYRRRRLSMWRGLKRPLIVRVSCVPSRFPSAPSSFSTYAIKWST